MSKIQRGVFVGIHLGGKNSCIAAFNNEKCEVLAGVDGSRNIPSAVYIGHDNEVYVGKSAYNYGHKNPKRLLYDIKRMLALKSHDPLYEKYKKQWNFETKRDTMTGYCNYKIDKQVYTPETILSELMKKLLSYAEEEIEGVVIAVPAYFSSEQKIKVLEAAKMANLNLLQLICEPTAAAIAYGMEHSYVNGETLFVFDMGEETFDITIIKISNSKDFTIIALGGDSNLGGRVFDDVIVNWMLKNLEEQVGNFVLSESKKRKLTEMAKEAKEALSQAEDADAVLQLSEIHANGIDTTLTRLKYEEISQGIIEKIEECITKTLQIKSLNHKEINHVLFIGSASKMPIIKKLLKKIFDPGAAKFSTTVNAEEIVALGATRLAAKLGKVSSRIDIQGLKIQDVIPSMIGIEVFENGQSRFRKIFNSYSPYGAEKIINLTTSVDNQIKSEIPLYEGTSDNLEKNKYIGNILLTNLSPGKAGENDFEVHIKLDSLGIIRVLSTNKSSKKYTAHVHIQEENVANEKHINVIGIDIGNTTCYAAVDRKYGIETVALENTGERGLLSYVSYDEKNAKFGKIVFTRMPQHSISSVYDIKKIIANPKINGNWPFQIIDDDTDIKIECQSYSGQIIKSIEEILTDFMKDVKQKCEEFQKRQLGDVVFAAPLSFTETQLKTIKNAASVICWNTIDFLPDPIAAFYAYYVTEPFLKNGYILTVDFGGNSLEICVLYFSSDRINIVNFYHDPNLGGKDFDTLIKIYVENHIKAEHVNVNLKNVQHKLKLDSQQIKEGFTYMNDENYDYLFEDVQQGIKMTIPISREHFKAISQDLLIQFQKTISTALLGSYNLEPDQINTVLQIGGGCRMPMIKKLLKSEFPNAQHLCHKFPQEVVAIGAAEYAKNLIISKQNETSNPSLPLFYYNTKAE